jgi:hypothetical protein
MALSVTDAADRVEQLLVLTERLTERLTAEANAFEARRGHEVAATVEETARLANLYRHEAARVKSDPTLVAGAPADRRAALVKATESFHAVMARHARALEAAKTITEGIVRAIAEEVTAARAPGPGYGPKARAYAGDATAVTLNRRA